jgi:hypothetical protein
MDFNSSRIPGIVWVFVLVIAAVIGLGLYGYLTGGWESLNVDY